MNKIKGKRLWIFLGILICVIIVSGIFGWFWIRNKTGPQTGTESTVEGFSFMGVGAKTPNTGFLRDSLEGSLGSISVESKTTIDLEKTAPGFLKKYFPDIDAFNRQLNDATGARVEHATQRWMFRYAQSQGIPFKYVEFLFSDAQHFPLYIEVTAKQGGSGMIEKFREKFHEPAELKWEDGQGRSLVWRYERDVLIASIVRDRFGNNEYHIVVYFTDNIRDLVETEKAEAEKKVERRERAVGSAF